MWHKFTSSAKRVIKHAHDEALALGSESVDSEHILLGILREPNLFATQVLMKLGVDTDRLRITVKSGIIQSDPANTSPNFSPDSKKILETAFSEAKTLRHTFLGSEHLLLGILVVTDSNAYTILEEHDVSYEDTRQMIEEMIQSSKRMKYAKQMESDLLDMKLSVESETLMRLAIGSARGHGSDLIVPMHILMALLRLPETDACSFLNKMGVNYDTLLDYLKSGLDIECTENDENIEDISGENAEP